MKAKNRAFKATQTAYVALSTLCVTYRASVQSRLHAAQVRAH